MNKYKIVKKLIIVFSLGLMIFFLNIIVKNVQPDIKKISKQINY